MYAPLIPQPQDPRLVDYNIQLQCSLSSSRESSPQQLLKASHNNLALYNFSAASKLISYQLISYHEQFTVYSGSKQPERRKSGA